MYKGKRIYIPYNRPPLSEKQKKEQLEREREQQRINKELREIYGPEFDPKSFGTY